MNLASSTVYICMKFADVTIDEFNSILISFMIEIKIRTKNKKKSTPNNQLEKPNLAGYKPKHQINQ